MTKSVLEILLLFQCKDSMRSNFMRKVVVVYIDKTDTKWPTTSYLLQGFPSYPVMMFAF